MPKESIFQDEWRECLREQYISAVRENDTVTLRTLNGVMLEVGFSEDELGDLYVQATMRAEDLPDDFVPDRAFAMPAVVAPEEVMTESVDEAAFDAAESEPEMTGEVMAETEAVFDMAFDMGIDEAEEEPAAAVMDDSDESGEETDAPSSTPDDDAGVTQLSLF